MGRTIFDWVVRATRDRVQKFTQLFVLRPLFKCSLLACENFLLSSSRSESATTRSQASQAIEDDRNLESTLSNEELSNATLHKRNAPDESLNPFGKAKCIRLTK